MGSGPSKRSVRAGSMVPAGSSGPTADGESQCPLGNTTSAYRPLPGISSRGSMASYGGMNSPLRANSPSAA